MCAGCVQAGRATAAGLAGRYATDGVATAFDATRSGMMNQATRYATMPRTIQPGIIVNIAQITRTSVGSTLKYSARPPHTPAIFRSVVDRVRRRVFGSAVAGLLESAMMAQAAI